MRVSGSGACDRVILMNTLHAMHSILNPVFAYGHCECGCGQKTRVSPVTHRRHGYVGGEPRRFVRGHTGARTVPAYEVVEAGCWEWRRNCDTRGYGKLRVSGGAQVGVHRLSYEYVHGPIADPSLCVLHRCDNPPCFNPDHLFLGTRAENIADMDAKGRRVSLSGSRNGRAKLTGADAAAIRAEHAAGVRAVDLARRYSVGKSAIHDILSGRKWSL